METRHKFISLIFLSLFVYSHWCQIYMKPLVHTHMLSNPVSPLVRSTWSLNRTSESGWPESSSGGNDNSPSGVVDKGMPTLDTQWAASSQANVTGSYGLDIKPFEPGKPWLVRTADCVCACACVVLLDTDR